MMSLIDYESLQVLGPKLLQPLRPQQSLEGCDGAVESRFMSDTK